jgi:ABC-type arginine/histidine transport system permease subunit
LLVVCGVAGNLLAMPIALVRVSGNRLLRALAYYSFL